MDLRLGSDEPMSRMGGVSVPQRASTSCRLPFEWSHLFGASWSEISKPALSFQSIEGEPDERELDVCPETDTSGLCHCSPLHASPCW